MRWMMWFMAACLGGIAAVLALLWAFDGFASLGLGVNGTIALVLGVAATSALGVGLMALSFYSNRSERDEAAYHAGRDEER
jgi:hypothetical protein